MRIDHDARTVLTLGARGVLEGRPFTLVSRTCLRGRRGALWNEWTLRFEDARSLFLVESGATFTLYEEGSILPSWDAVTPGSPLDTGFVVVERGHAERVAQWGEVEQAPSTYSYAELSSRTGQAATIDFGGGTPRLFLGRKTSLAELGLTPREEPRRFVSVPEWSRPNGVELWLEVGDVGDLDGTRFRVIGMLSRSTDGGTNTQGATKRAREHISWDEYLLYDPHDGFRWLVVADGHWSIVETVEVGLIRETDESVTLGGELYRALPQSVARVDWATGELPWEVMIGDESNVRDFVGPETLTKEWTADEVSWSRGTHVSPDVIAKVFRKRTLPKPVGRAPTAAR